ncbi:hypothetical protein G6038_09585 [Rhodococcus sp. 14C212]|uniref:hypothetical protein n=1 Tax=Rhodococcus sp. 14C212 TaxID=2711209 RepID=UPI0013EC745B|nr:hypothetical protein [Rhodococcus sp. 14C212]NGP05727.1 hypothetical protein [Rhodococcus sp. 14C212]
MTAHQRLTHAHRWTTAALENLVQALAGHADPALPCTEREAASTGSARRREAGTVDWSVRVCSLRDPTTTLGWVSVTTAARVSEIQVRAAATVQAAHLYGRDAEITQILFAG